MHRMVAMNRNNSNPESVNPCLCVAEFVCTSGGPGNPDSRVEFQDIPKTLGLEAIMEELMRGDSIDSDTDSSLLVVFDVTSIPPLSCTINDAHSSNPLY